MNLLHHDIPLYNHHGHTSLHACTQTPCTCTPYTHTPYTHPPMHAHALHTRTHAHTHHACAHPTRTHPCTHTPCMRTPYTHPPMHTHTHTHTHKQTNLKNNNNKFYICQLLEDNTSRTYSTWFRWGRGKIGSHREPTAPGSTGVEVRLVVMAILLHLVPLG